MTLVCAWNSFRENRRFFRAHERPVLASVALHWRPTFVAMRALPQAGGSRHSKFLDLAAVDSDGARAFLVPGHRGHALVLLGKGTSEVTHQLYRELWWQRGS